ncbi:MAG: hypothetical protein A2Y10_00790 [Planctomycetes bacterium GWF2_41_51]|nr:MAG: hypothetical protein A2Y10_00790 [Planctomycetes bacterium GWF2_41_51]HBG26748.1 hypothetical protein [Phycisphaerales bacterium]
MGDESINKIFAGKITSGVKLQTFQLAIINFVFEQLPNWRDDPDRSDVDSEPLLNPQLSNFLDCKARDNSPMFHFCHEEPQAINRTVDMAAKTTENMLIEAKLYTKYDPVLVFECKRLPAPEIKREKEYVSGKDPNKISGGIQRFKLGHHGAKHDLAAMIGYVQDESFNHWQDKINEWILELVKNPIGDSCNWNPTEILNMAKEDTSIGAVHYLSTHKRNGTVESEIEIHHLWVMMRN